MIEGLQQLRCLAVVLVVWVHAAQYFAVERGVRLPTLGVFGIDIFFVISGFIVAGSVLRDKKGAGSFLRRRFLRIYPVYWVVGAVGALRLLLEHKALGSATVGALLLLPNCSTWLAGSLVDGSWTLAFEMFFYVSLFGCMLVARREKAVWLLALLLTACGLAGALATPHTAVWNVVFNPLLFEFIAGALLSMLFARLRHMRRLGAGLAAGGCGLAIALAAHPLPAATGMQMVLMNQGVLLRVLTWGVAALLIVAGVVLGALRVPGRLGRGLSLCGDSSYSAYLLEMYAVVYCTRALQAWGIARLLPGTAFAVTGSVLCVVAALGLGLLNYRLVERPLLARLHRVAPHNSVVQANSAAGA